MASFFSYTQVGARTAALAEGKFGYGHQLPNTCSFNFISTALLEIPFDEKILLIQLAQFDIAEEAWLKDAGKLLKAYRQDKGPMG